MMPMPCLGRPCQVDMHAIGVALKLCYRTPTYMHALDGNHDVRSGIHILPIQALKLSIWEGQTSSRVT